jgi:formimidoylglutamate deiminase
MAESAIENCVHARHAMLPGGWAADTEIGIDSAGQIAAVRSGVPYAGGAVRAGLVIPGVPNVHSHAFQRAMAGRAEHMVPGADNFWTWREGMYTLANALSPVDLETIATLAYCEMLAAGYTAVCEFHYLHHGPGGQRYSDRTETSRALIRAARSAGIRLVLLPVLYMHGGFGARATEPRQAAFVNAVPEYLGLLEALSGLAERTVSFGVAFHSLRAVSPEAMEHVLDAVSGQPLPIHLHIAEQAREVRDCEAWSGKRPIAWLLDRGIADERWCLVHATHANDAELRGIAAAGAVVGLCPTTEANLGDGVFPLEPYLAAGGRMAIGSDSQVSVSPVEELRWLEYGQRLALGRRNVGATAAEPHTGARLFRSVVAGGAQALGVKAGAIAPGQAADLLELDAASPSFAGAGADEVLDRLVFAGNRPLVKNVMVAGRWVVRGGRHPDEESAAAGFARVMARLKPAP